MVYFLLFYLFLCGFHSEIHLGEYQSYFFGRRQSSISWCLAYLHQHFQNYVYNFICYILYIHICYFLLLHSYALPHVHRLLMYLFIYKYKELLIPSTIILHKLVIKFYIYENTQRKFRFLQLLNVFYKPQV